MAHRSGHDQPYANCRAISEAKIDSVAVGGRNSKITVKNAVRTMLRMNKFRLPIRTANQFEATTPTSSAVSPKPLNQLKSLSLPTQYLKNGSITLPRMEMAPK